MQNHEESLEEKIYLIADLGLPKMGSNRLKWRHSEIKTLYQLYLGHKQMKRGAWTSIWPSREKIREKSHISVSSIRNFINADYFSIYGAKQERFEKGHQTSNEYRLKPWVCEVFEF